MNPVALVTGGNRGIGLEVVRGLVRAGYDVVLGCRSSELGDAAKADVLSSVRSATASVSVLPMDVTAPPTTLCDAVAGVLRPAGGDAAPAAGAGGGDGAGATRRLRLLVNNAGVYLDGWTKEAYDTTLAINYTGPVGLTRHLLPLMEDGGRVVQVSSGLGMYNEQLPQHMDAIKAATTLEDLAAACPFDASLPLHGSFKPCYKLSKAKLNRATQLLATHPDFTARDVRVSAVCPGWVATRMGGASAPRTPTQGAQSVLCLALHDDMPNGAFTRDGKPLKW